MKIIHGKILSRFPEIIHGVSTQDFSRTGDSFGFNLSFSVGDDPARVLKNREEFFEALGTTYANAAYQKQIHSDVIKVVEAPGFQGESDAMITTRKGIALAISVADCTPILLYDFENKIIAGIHSGWRGTRIKITEKTLKKMIKDYGSTPANIVAYVGPSICQEHYEVGKEVAELFEEKFVLEKDGKYFLDVAGANVEMLLEAGIPQENIEHSELCTFEAKGVLHSYRRDREKSGRGFAVIMMKEDE